MAGPMKDWRQDQHEMTKRHAAEIEASSNGAKEREIKELIQAYEVKLRASQGTEFVNLQVELNRKITEVQSKIRPGIQDLKKRHQRELQDHLMLCSQPVRAPSRSSPGLQPSSLASNETPSNQSNIRPAKRPLAEVRDWTTSLELDGTRVRWMLRTARESAVAKRQRTNNASHISQKPKAPATIKMLRYGQVRSNAIKDGHWDTIVEWPASSGQFWVVFCAKHNMHFKKLALVAGAKHVNGSLHGAPNKDYSTALTEIGYYIPDCNEERAVFHNAEVQKMFEKGYQPCNRANAKAKAERSIISDVASPPPPSLQPSGRRERRFLTNPKPFHVYCCWFEKQWWACLILGWDRQIDACYVSTLEETKLFHKRAKPPKCYIRTNQKIEGWAEGYEDGGPKVHLREFPIMYFDGEKHYGWCPADSLSKVDLTAAPKGEEYPESSYNEARQWIATAAGYSTWEDYRASNGNIRNLTPATMSERQTPALQPTNPPSDHSVSDFDEVCERLRERGGDDTDDEDYRDDGRGLPGRPLSRYVIDYEDDEWTAKYNTRQEGTSAAKSSATQACKLPGKDQKSGAEHEPEPVTRPTQRQMAHSPTIPPANLSPNGMHDRSSESRPSPGIGAPRSESVPPARTVASVTVRRTKPTGAGFEPGSSKGGCCVPDLRALARDSLSRDGKRDAESQPPEAPRGPAMETAVLDDRPSACPTPDIANQGTTSEGPAYAGPKQRGASANSRTTTMSGEAMTGTPNQPLVASPISMALTPTTAAPSPTASADARPRTFGQPRMFEITKYADATRTWERGDREEACVKLCLSEDEKTVATSDERISIVIDPQQCMKPQVQTIEGREGMSCMTLARVSGEVISMVFDRSRGSKIELGKIQARNFVRWLQAQNAKLR